MYFCIHLFKEFSRLRQKEVALTRAILPVKTQTSALTRAILPGKTALFACSERAVLPGRIARVRALVCVLAGRIARVRATCFCLTILPFWHLCNLTYIFDHNSFSLSIPSTSIKTTNTTGPKTSPITPYTLKPVYIAINV